jgi:sulfite reductase (ferredoxin)
MSEYKLPEGFSEELKQFENLTVDYINHRIDTARYKPVRVPWGIYEQRETGRFMVRVRLSGGDISPQQLKGLAEISKFYSDKPLHLTTRGDIQLHNLAIANVPYVLEKLAELGLSSRGGGGNTVRNITADWLAGYAEDEVFDVSPYAGILTTLLIAENDSWGLPRKYKIAFSGSGADRAYATVSDLGFIAVKNQAGENGFRVFAAGGMGRKPSAGMLLHEFINVPEIYFVAKAIKNLFNKYGNRKNRHAARLRFLLEREGKESFTKKYLAELYEVKKTITPPVEITTKKSTGKYIEIPQFLGDLDAEEALKIAAAAEKYGESSLRITPFQNVLIKNIDPEDLAGLRDSLEKTNILKKARPVIDGAIACAGASTCRLGICLSRGVLSAISAALSGGESGLKKVADVKLKISGCPNSCGQHPVADIGLFGVVKRHGDNPLPAYNIVAGAFLGPDGSRLAEHIGIIPARAVPQFIKEALLETAEYREKGESFSAYFERFGREKFKGLAAKFSAVPEISESSEYYYDWGAEKQFSATEKLEGECSAGLFDLIELDFKESEASLKAALAGENISGNLKKAVASASRALLITKGIEAGNDAEAVLAFKDNFLGKHIPNSGAAPVNKYLTGSSIGTIEAQNLLISVKELYLKMDDSLRLPEQTTVENAAETVKTEKRDFRGVKCPLNFVKTKLALEPLKAGDLLEILLDDGEPIENVPASLIGEGHKIIEKTKEEGHWKVRIQKGT